MEYQIKKLNYSEMEAVYDTWIYEHFPADEVKPLESIKRMWEMDCYFALGIYTKEENARLAGYAFFVKAPQSDRILLDYLAVIETYRNCGIGSIFLKQMQDWAYDCKGILIETEDIAFAKDDAERHIREKRNAFYARNGALLTSVKGEVYGVHFCIWNYPVGKEKDRQTISLNVFDEEVRKDLESIYRVIAPGEKYEKHIRISS